MLHIKAREFAQNGNVEVGGIADISEEWPEGEVDETIPRSLRRKRRRRPP